MIILSYSVRYDRNPESILTPYPYHIWKKIVKNKLVAVKIFILVADRQVVHGPPTKQCNM